MERIGVNSLLSAAFLLLSLLLTDVEGECLVTFPCTASFGVPIRIALSSFYGPEQGPILAKFTLWKTHPWQQLPWNAVDVARRERSLLASNSSPVQAGGHVIIALQPENWTDVEHFDELAVSLIVENSRGKEIAKKYAFITLGQSRSVLLQTDKPVYKPGQDVRLRVLAFNSNLMPYHGKMSVQIRNSEKTVMAEWQNITLENGIWSKTFPLSSQPPLGVWTIECNNPGSSELLADAQIEIKEYAALPKFDVSLDLPPHISLEKTAESAFAITVRARYIYGQPVRGNVSLQMSVIRFRSSPDRIDLAQPFCSYTGNAPLFASFAKPQGALVPLQRRVPIAGPKSLRGWLKRKPKVWTHHLQLDESGQASFLLTKQQLRDFLCSLDYSPSRSTAAVHLKAKVAVVDNVTMEARSESKESVVQSEATVDLEFDTLITKNTYRPGLPMPIRILVTNPHNKQPAPNTTKVLVRLKVNRKSFSWTFSPTNGEVYKTIVVPGVISGNKPPYIEAGVPDGRGSMKIRAWKFLVQEYPRKEFFFKIVAFKSRQSLGQQAMFYVSTGTASRSAKRLVCSVYARSQLLRYFSLPNAIARPGRRTIFSVMITKEMSPVMRLVCFAQDSRKLNLAMDSIDVVVSNLPAIPRKLSVTFSKDKARPGDNATVVVRSLPNSTVCLGVVDQKALLVARSNDITVSRLEQELEAYLPISNINVLEGFHGHRDALSQAGICTMNEERFQWPAINPALPAIGQPYSALPARGRVAGVHLSPPQVIAREAKPSAHSAGASPKRKPKSKTKRKPTHIRQHFPETWLWETLITSSNGSAALHSKVPDSITSWVATGFAMSPSEGLALAQDPTTLTVFTPFFLSLNLPYSIIQGERLHLQVFLYNYMAASDVTVELKPSLDVRVLGTPFDGVARRQTTVPSNGAGRVEFTIMATKAGYITLDISARSEFAADRVQKQLIVEPGGIPQSYFKSVLISVPRNQTIFSENLNLDLPSDVVPGSVRTEVSVIGDLMGPALSNLDQLLKMPTGCGEQNMLGFAPDVFIMKYLTNTKQLTQEVAEKAKRYMTTGYQRQLTYRHEDYSFSAFGKSDDSGSLWLTAFVVKSFAQARPYIHIDVKDLSHSMHYILDQQQPDGSFPLRGTVVHKAMKGGLRGEMARTAYILTTLLEAEDVPWDQISASFITAQRRKSQEYLEQRLNSNITDNYTLALMSYALALRGSSHASRAVDILLQRADRVGNGIFWRGEHRHGKWDGLRFQCFPAVSPVSIELTAYALLALLHSGRHIEALYAGEWLVQQRNSHGGFGSTQDTVVGLQALAELAEVQGVAGSELEISLATSTGFHHTFQLDASNQKALQTVSDLPVPSSLNITATGDSRGLLSLEVFYNVKAAALSPYAITTDCVLNISSKENAAECSYCTWRSKADPGDVDLQDEMSLLEVNVPSGYEVNLEKLIESSAPEKLVKRIENPDRRVVLYLDEVPERRLCVSMDMKQVNMVGNLQPTMVRTVNYYEPSIESSHLYRIPAVEFCEKNPHRQCRQQTRKAASTHESSTFGAIPEAIPSVPIPRN